jgi:hypothetical protein
MNFSSVRTTALVVMTVFLASVIWSGAGAQTQRGYKDPLAPKRSSIDKKLQRHFNPGIPQTKADRAARRIFDDPLRKLGLPGNNPNNPTTQSSPGVTAPVFDPGVAHLDRDGDGAVSRSEYFQGRSRLITPGRNADRRAQSHRRRLDSRFRRADTNRDGKVSPAELKATGVTRF